VPALRGLALAFVLALVTSGVAAATPARAQRDVVVIAPVPGTFVGPGVATVHVELALHGVDPGRLRVIVERRGSHQSHRRRDISDHFTFTTANGVTSAIADLGARELGTGIIRLSAWADHAHAATSFDVEPDLDLAAGARCDFLMPTRCLLPYPSDFYTVADPASPTGRRINLDARSLPANVHGVHIDPTEWNRNDGFSPGQPIMLSFPGIDLAQTGAAPITDVARSLRRDAPIVIVDAESGRRWPYFAEMDVEAPDDASRTMIIRPAVNFLEGHRYVVGLRNLKDAHGDPIAPSRAFEIYRDRIKTFSPIIERRRPAMQRVFSALHRARVGRHELSLAWDFTIASAQGIAGRMLHVRDDAFDALGAGVPGFTVDTVEQDVSSRVYRRITGTFQVPLYLDHDGVSGSRFVYGADDLPERQPRDYTAQYQCVIPPSATGDPARFSLYGHGLLGSFDEVNSSIVLDMAVRHNTAYCGTNFIGLAEDDYATAIAILQDTSRFPTLADRSQQGFLNFLFLGRLMIHPNGFGANSAFRLGTHALVDTSELFYDGNSEGAIFGGALTAVAQDFTRSVLGEAGMNYSLLLQRSVDFDTFKLIFAPSYPDEYDRLVTGGLTQMLWDRGETNGYAQHLTRDPYPGTPAHTILLLGAVGDHQVAQVSLEIEARTIGARVHRPFVAPGRTHDVEPAWGIPSIAHYPFTGSAYFLWDTGSPLAPIVNAPPREGHDPHDDTPRQPAVQDLKDGFWRGAVTDVCNGGPCLGVPF
jgi:hypothetical protein